MQKIVGQDLQEMLAAHGWTDYSEIWRPVSKEARKYLVYLMQRNPNTDEAIMDLESSVIKSHKITDKLPNNYEYFTNFIVNFDHKPYLRSVTGLSDNLILAVLIKDSQGEYTLYHADWG